MPTRRIMEVSAVVAILLRPIFGLVRMWAGKTMRETDNGSISHGAAEIAAVVF